MTELSEEEIKSLTPDKVLDLYHDYQKLKKTNKKLSDQTESLQQQTQNLQSEIVKIRSEEFHRRWKVETPPTFHGNKSGPKVSMWLFHLRQYFETTGITEESMIVNYAASLLRDNAMVWWKCHIDLADRKIVPRIATWTDFYAAITSEFQPINTTKIARDKLAELKQRNSVQSYAFEFRNIVAELPSMTEEEKVDKFIRGLKDRTRQEVDIRDPKSLEEAIRIADRFDAISFQSHRKQIQKIPYQRSNPTPMELDNVNMKKEFREERRTERNEACFLCGKVGHYKHQCPTRKKFQAKGSSQ